MTPPVAGQSVKPDGQPGPAPGRKRTKIDDALPGWMHASLWVAGFNTLVLAIIWLAFALDVEPKKISSATSWFLMFEVAGALLAGAAYMSRLDLIKARRVEEDEAAAAALAPGGAAGFDASDSPSSPYSPPRRSALDITHRRRRLGYVLGVISIGLFGLVIALSIHELGKLATPRPTNDIEARYAIVVLVAHGIVAVALVFFCYQLLRAAERMIIPDWWVTDHLESAKVILGVEDPITAASKLVDRVAAIAQKVQGKEAKESKDEK